MKKTLGLAALAAAFAGAAPLPVSAQETIYVPLLTYRTGPFAVRACISPTACATTSRC